MFEKIIQSAAIFVLVAYILGQQTPGVFAQSASPSPANNQQRLQDIISKGDADISQRITSLASLQTKLQSMKKLSDSDKATLISQIQAQINGLNSQKTKLDGDTDVATARADRQAIFTQFRIYMLFIPKVQILAAADAMNDAADSINSLVAKLQAKIQQFQQSGKDVSSLQTALADMQSKLADAKAQYQNAESTVLPLVPDQGDKTKAQSNTAALQSAQGMIKTGAQDLKTARADIQTIVNGLKSLRGTTSSPAGSSVPTR